MLNETRLRDSVAETSGLVVRLGCFRNESYVIICCVVLSLLVVVVVVVVIVVVIVVDLKSGREASIYTLTPGILEASTRFY
jgi:hypothetical protein